MAALEKGHPAEHTKSYERCLKFDMTKNYILRFICLVLTHVEQGRFSSCISEGTSYICRDIQRIVDLPFALPNFVDKVTLIGAGESMESFPKSPFNDRSWENVSELTLLKFEDIYKIEKSFLDGLSHLRYLSISALTHLRYIDPDVFQSTPDLSALHLDGDINLELSVIEKALEGKVSKLKYLSLQGLSMDHVAPGILGKRFFNALRGKNITYLDVSSANIAGIVADSKDDTYSSWLYVDVSHSKLALIGIGHKGHFDTSLSKLEMVDVSGCLSIMQSLREQAVMKIDCDIPPRLKYVFSEAIVKPDIRIELDIEAQFNRCIHNNIEIVDLSRNRLIHLNVTVTGTYSFRGLVKLNLSMNDMQYISPSLLGSFPSLQILDLSENQLHKMQKMDDFNNILYDNSHYLTVDLSDNPIECSCENLSFLTWCVSTKMKFVNRKTLICKYGNANYPIDSKTLEKIEFDCQLPRIIMKAILATGSVILCSCGIVYLVYRMHRKKCSMEDIEILKRFINQRQENDSYVAFIPYCSIDSDIIEKNILTALRNCIMKKLNIDCEVLCTGNNFIPGMLIINEIHRCIDESLLVVPIITPAFVQSPWSQTECVVAIQKHRKVVVLMQEQTDISQAERSIQHLIAHYTRATWSNRNGSVTIHPSWNIICDRIISLAAETLKNQEQQRIKELDCLNPLIEEDTL
ncbi:hypothetical protein CHS0354_042731 [Potamilus streckersoni]|uniref:TIR domain-containing protein n=1 Tax=Potamilus streckersoni TaxID=2493646 RepID=A0AAE0S9F3_9BIVA|nr:hypothetical protein CHS0354_042731 [Potamilus streckersoni]